MRIQILSDQEVQALLTHLSSIPIRDNLILRFLLQTGLRAGEVSNLNVDNVWCGGHVHPAVSLPRGTTKGHVGRYVDMPAPLRDLLGPYVQHLFNPDNNLGPQGALFRSVKQERRLGVRDIERMTARVSLIAIGRSIHPHLLRHTYATTLLRYTNIRVIQTLLGHKSIATTQIYTHPSSEDCKNAVNQAFDR